MRYDATRAALLHPEGAGRRCSPRARTGRSKACGAECSRLAYVRFETDDPQQGPALTEAIACAGLGEPGFFFGPGYRHSGIHGDRYPRLEGRFVVFRGTQPDDPSDIGTDAQAVLVDWQAQGKVHLGFRDALHSVWGPISEWLLGSYGARNLGHRS